MLVSLTVGKVDAGVAVLLTQDNRLVSRSVPRPWSHGNPPNRCLLLYRTKTRLNCMLISTHIDRVPLRSPPQRHLQRKYRRHHRCAQPRRRNRQRNRLPIPPEAHPKHLRCQGPLASNPPPTKCNPDLPRSRMGPNRPRNRVSEIPLPLPQRLKGRLHTPSPRHAQHKD